MEQCYNIFIMNFKNLFSKKDKKDISSTTDNISAAPLTLNTLESIIHKRVDTADKELEKGYNLIKKYPRSVSILGSARFTQDSIYYKHAQSLSARIARDLKYAVVTGGGPGIMEAANRGSFEAGGVSLGFTIILPQEQKDNPYLTDHVDFEYFFTRKTLLFFSAETYIYYPGGFGTFDELFEILTLIQTKKIPSTPVILVGREFWKPLLELIDNKLYRETYTINLEDQNIYKIVDSEDEIIEIIKNAPFRQE